MFKNLSTGAIGIRANMREGLDLAKNAGFEGLDLNIDEANQTRTRTLCAIRQRPLVRCGYCDGWMGFRC